MQHPVDTGKPLILAGIEPGGKNRTARARRGLRSAGRHGSTELAEVGSAGSPKSGGDRYGCVVGTAGCGGASSVIQR